MISSPTHPHSALPLRWPRLLLRCLRTSADRGLGTHLIVLFLFSYRVVCVCDLCAEVLIAFALCALAAPSVLAVPLGSACSSDDQCMATTANSACRLGVCAPTDGAATRPDGELGGACLTGNVCNGDLQCADSVCVAPVDGVQTCSETQACPDNKLCTNGLCVVPGENGAKCDTNNPCNSGFSCVLGYCADLPDGKARCACTCNGDEIPSFVKVPAESCVKCGDVCDPLMGRVCTTGGLGIVVGNNEGQSGFSCVQANPQTGEPETVTSNPDGTTTTTPGGDLDQTDGTLTPSAAAVSAFPSAIAAIAILALAVVVQL